MVSGCGCSENVAAGTKLCSAAGRDALEAAAAAAAAAPCAAAGCRAISCGAAEAVAAAAAAAAFGSAWYGCWTGNGTATSFWKGSAHGSVTQAPFGWWCIAATTRVRIQRPASPPQTNGRIFRNVRNVRATKCGRELGMARDTRKWLTEDARDRITNK